jgi:putative metallohydrolase (TIGR04338 family)
VTDQRRGLVYGCESLVIDMVDRGARVDFHGSVLTPDPDRKFGQVADVQRYLVWLRSHEWAYPELPAVDVRVRRGAAKATWEAPGTIALPDAAWARREMIVLHEYAHHVSWHTGQQSDHGARFCRVQADLVRNAIGPSTGLLLTDAYHRAGLFDD